MGADDEDGPLGGDEGRDLPQSIWFDLLNVVPFMALAAYLVSDWLF